MVVALSESEPTVSRNLTTNSVTSSAKKVHVVLQLRVMQLLSWIQTYWMKVDSGQAKCVSQYYGLCLCVKTTLTWIKKSDSCLVPSIIVVILMHISDNGS